MICPPCARLADAVPGTPHVPDECDDWGRDIRACGCAHGAETPPADHQPSLERP